MMETSARDFCRTHRRALSALVLRACGGHGAVRVLSRRQFVALLHPNGGITEFSRKRITRLAATPSPGETVHARPYDLLAKVFPEEPLRVFRILPVEYHCPLDPESVRRMLLSLGRAELESILAEPGELRIRNEMCNHEYRFDRAAIDALFH